MSMLDLWPTCGNQRKVKTVAMKPSYDIRASEDPETVARTAVEFIETFLEESGLKGSKLERDMKDGLTPAQSMGLRREDLNVLYTLAFQRLNSGALEDAYNLLAFLVMIDPLHAPNYYCYGVCEQLRGNLEDAEKAFISFLALDATNPVGYIRLGEVYLAKDEKGQAKSLFEVAEAECLKGNGDSITLEEARSKMRIADGKAAQ